VQNLHVRDELIRLLKAKVAGPTAKQEETFPEEVP